MDFLGTFGQALTAGNAAALPLALAGGVIAGLNPCCLALYPAAVGACCPAQAQAIKRPFGNAVAFVFGVAVAVAALGVLAAYIGRVAVIGTPVKYAIALIPLAMGAYRLGWVRLPLPPARTLRPGVGGAFGTGLLLSLVIGPCGTPVLASVLAFAGYQRSFAFGGLLLFLYGIGSGVPLMVVGTAAGRALSHLDHSRFGKWIDPTVGGMLVLLGFYLLWRA